MTKRWLTPALAALAMGTGAAALAAEPASPAPAPASVALLGLEAIGVPDAVAAELSESLRQRVAVTEGLRLVPGKDLVEIKLVFGCSDEAPACMAQAGSTLGATKVIFGNVRRAGADYVVMLKMVDVGKAAVDAYTTDAIAVKRAEPSTYQTRTARWIGKLTGRETTGRLQVQANVAGAAITLDGVAVGLTDTQPVSIPDVAPGRHEIAAQKQGYGVSRQEFTVGAGQSLPLSLSLTPVSLNPTIPEPVVVRRTPDAPAAATDDGSTNLARVGFWTALVGAATSAALAAKFGHDVKRINGELDPLRRYGCGEQSPTGLCNKDGAPASALTLSERGTAASKTDEGNRAQTLQWVFVGLIPPFAIAGGYLLYKGYLDDDPSGTASNHGLRIFPTASASAGGVMAEFDF